jgi:orotate phosphoribosyltransferase
MAAPSPDMQKYRDELIAQSMQVGALKFGSFVLKSGRYAQFQLYPRTIHREFFAKITAESLPTSSTPA